MKINVIKKYLKTIIAYLPAFSFISAYLLFQYLILELSRRISPSQLVCSLIFFCLVLVVLGFILHKIVKDHTKAGFILWVISELFLLSQPFFVISAVVTVIMVLVWIGVTQLRKKPLLLNHATFLLSSLGFALIFILLATDKTPLNLYLQGAPQKADPPRSELVISGSPPDIYYIILDGYARNDILEDLFDFENSEFTDYLTDKGFIIPPENHSNYGTSILSETATLNMQYVQNLISDAEGWPYLWLLSPFIKNNTVKTMLEEAGYNSISIDVNYEVINDGYVDIYYSPLLIRLNEFEKFLIQTSPIKIFSPLIRKFALINTYSSHRTLVNFAFSTLSEIPELDGPKFIYSHIISPHPPFVFDKDGQYIEPSYGYTFWDGVDYPGTNEQYKQGYVGQLKYVNHRMIQTVESILEKSETSPIIIIMGDHGSRLFSDFSVSEHTCIPESFSNFMALHLPGLDSDQIPPDITSVNVFRLIFDHYFQTEFGMLENGYYFFSDKGVPYGFEDVGPYMEMDCEDLQ